MITMRMPACLLAYLLAAAGTAGAQALPDPTRPPAALNARAAASGTAEPSGPQLQSVLVSQGRRLAVIDGETYRVGQKVNGALLAAVGDDQVVLVQDKQRQVLKLYPTQHAVQHSAP
jgi:MSHA biogenesis protein MshK